MKEIGIGLLGLGTVGSGVVKGLRANADLIAKRTGLRLVLRRVAELNPARAKALGLDPDLVTQDAGAVIDDPRVDVVVELIGGTGAAKDLTLRALAAGKPVVTANKALLAEHGAEIFAAAEAHNVDLYYEASVGGGIPIIRSLREGLIANHIENIYGILNGTCNYILTTMEETGQPFDAVLKDAQDLGYAEAEPSLDVDGWDTAHKAVILASLAYGIPVTLDQLEVRGIREVADTDIRAVHELGYRIKLLAVVKHVAGGDVTVGVEPALVPLEHPLAAVAGVFCAVLVQGDVVGDTLYYGRGAGDMPTASAVLSDLADVARNLVSKSERRVPALVQHGHYGRLTDMGTLASRYYLRVTLQDHPGMLARIASILGDHGISIATVMQKDAREGGCAPVIIVTYASRGQAMQAALSAIDALDVVGAQTVSYRIEDFAV